MESGRDVDYDDGDDGDDDDEEFDSIKLKTSVATISRTNPKTCDSRNAHLEPVSTTTTTTTTSTPRPETTITKIIDSSKVTITNNHFKDSVWSKASLGIKCNDEINLRLSDPTASSTTTTPSTTKTIPTTTTKSAESTKSSIEQIKREKDVFPQLVNGNGMFHLSPFAKAKIIVKMRTPPYLDPVDQIKQLNS